MDVHHLSRTDARRIAVRAQLLERTRPAGLLDVVRRLTLLQLDPTAAVAPNAHLVAWSRLGAAYRRDELRAELEKRSLVELRALVRPAEDIALYRAEMARWPNGFKAAGDWMTANDACRRDVLARLEASGPLQSRELPDTCAVPWKSTGWTNNRNMTRMLEFLSSKGEVAVAGRTEGGERLWDLAARVYPDDPVVPAAEAEQRRNERRLAALGIARARRTQVPVEQADVGTAGEPAVVEGVKGEWRVDPVRLAQVGRPFAGRTALLSPFDRLVHDRERALELFDFEYQLEMYKPVAKRRWGYFALPVLYGDRLVGKLDAAADRKAGVFRVHALHQDTPFDAATTAAVEAEIRALADWLELDLLLPAG
ncbi:hypothetical protein SRB5_04850 [Streptomyces sp. RB5]|uniref:Winged helix-turn-helix domain-containing protein n=1 Tax=Streptomyces smaragdinus TaxID=2585196 RepID=A0A7K0CA93_9ACTN|nr:crosslink repair DNA glycosylase YcaQ family protein [Streptomyces smaragdinus]MQY10377.1 hypothetical protein [Streptomyces smaragdinus]